MHCLGQRWQTKAANAHVRIKRPGRPKGTMSILTTKRCAAAGQSERPVGIAAKKWPFYWLVEMEAAEACHVLACIAMVSRQN